MLLSYERAAHGDAAQRGARQKVHERLAVCANARCRNAVAQLQTPTGGTSTVAYLKRPKG